MLQERVMADWVKMRYFGGSGSQTKRQAQEDIERGRGQRYK